MSKHAESTKIYPIEDGVIVKTSKKLGNYLLFEDTYSRPRETILIDKNNLLEFMKLLKKESR